MNKKLFSVLVILILFGLGIILAKEKDSKNSVPFSIPTTTNEGSKDSPQTEVLFQNLEGPWAMTHLPNGDLLITERKGTIRKLDTNGTLSQVFEVENVSQVSESGLHGITVHPNFSSNNFIYIYYTYSSSGGNNLNRIERYRFDGQSFSDRKVILDGIPAAAIHDGGRIKFGPDGFLYITTGDAADPSHSQNKNSLGGKILRVDDNGTIPSGNPFGNAVYSYGHRNPQGLTWDDEGNLWETEHGSSATDELNKIQVGKNFGWPDVRGDQKASGIISPIAQSGSETWAPAGLAYVNDSLFFGGLRGQALFEAKINGNTVELVKHFDGELGRIRDVVVGPDGLLYISTSNRDGRGLPRNGDDKVIRVNPEKLN